MQPRPVQTGSDEHSAKKYMCARAHTKIRTFPCQLTYVCKLTYVFGRKIEM